MNGAQAMVKCLENEGVEMVFGYPGVAICPFYDSLLDTDIKSVLIRTEQNAAHAASGLARVTGKVGVCAVTSGPGATNLITGIATAFADSIPLVCITGQVNSELIGSDVFQEADITGAVESFVKYSYLVKNAEDIPQIFKEAFYIANTGKKGPVVVDLPKDIMLEEGDDLYPKEVKIRSYKPSKGVHIGQLKKANSLLSQVKKPLFLMGGGVNISGANEEAKKLAELTQVPVITTIMGKGALPTNHELYIGNVGMHGCYAANHAISECDLLFSIGTRFNDRITGKIDEFAKNAKIVHIDIDAASISRNIQVDIPIVADAKEAMTALLKHAKPCDTKDWLEEIRGWEKEQPLGMRKDKGITPQKIIECMNEEFKKAVVVTDVGQHQMWVTQYLEMDENKKLLTSGGLGTMGYGLPAAIGAKFGYPDTPVICVSGDGGVQMNIQELATATAYGLPVILCIFNNSYLGMVRQWQQLFYGKRYSSTCTRRRKSCSATCKGSGEQCPKYQPDFVKLAESYEAYGMRIEKEEDIKKAFEFAKEHTDAPTILEFMIDSDELVLPMVQGGQALDCMILDC